MEKQKQALSAYFPHVASFLGVICWLFARHRDFNFDLLRRNMNLDISALSFSPWLLVRALLINLCHLIGIGIFFTFCALIGKFLLQWLSASVEKRQYRMELCLALGFLLSTQFLFGIGLTGIFFREIFIALAILAGLVVIVQKKKIIGIFSGVISEGPVWLKATIAAGLFLVAITPELETDSINHYIPLANSHLFMHKISLLTTNLIAWYTHASEMALTGFIALGLEQGGRFMNMLWILLTCNVMAKLAGKYTDKTGNWLVPVALLTTFAIPSLLYSSKNDLCCLFIAGISISVLLESGSGASFNYLTCLILGLMAGLGFSVKLISVPLIIMIFIVYLAGRKSPYQSFRGALLFIVSFLVPALPWMFKTFLEIGNPVFPLLPRIFISPYFPEGSIRVFQEGAHRPDGNIAAILNAIPSTLSYLLSLNIFVCCLIPPLLISGIRVGREIKACIFTGFLFTIIWAIGFSPIDRYGISLVIPGLIIAKKGFDVLGEFRLKGISRNAICAGALFLYFPVLLIECCNLEGIACGMGLIPRKSYYHRQLGTLFEAMNVTLDSTTGRVLTVGESRMYPINDKRIITYTRELKHPLWNLAQESRNGQEIAVGLRKKGIRWILYNSAHDSYESGVLAFYRWTPSSIDRYREFLSRWTEPVWSSRWYDAGNGFYLLYKVLPKQLNRPRPIYFMPGTEGEFHRLKVLESGGGLFDPIIDKEIGRLEGYFSGVGIFESRKAHLFLARSRNSTDYSKWCSGAAKILWKLGASQGKELDDVLKPFNVQVIPVPHGKGLDWAQEEICGRRMELESRYFGFSLMEGHPVYLFRGEKAGY